MSLVHRLRFLCCVTPGVTNTIKVTAPDELFYTSLRAVYFLSSQTYHGCVSDSLNYVKTKMARKQNAERQKSCFRDKVCWYIHVHEYVHFKITLYDRREMLITKHMLQNQQT